MICPLLAVHVLFELIEHIVLNTLDTHWRFINYSYLSFAIATLVIRGILCLCIVHVAALLGRPPKAKQSGVEGTH